jgi:hypothetical protein
MAVDELLFLSLRAPAFELRGIDHIVVQSRLRNAAATLTGVLAFDGLHFAELLEGPPDALREAATRIAADPRHVDYRVLHAGPLRGARRFADWDMVFLLADDRIDALPSLAALRGPAAVEGFLRCLPHGRASG